MKTQLAKPVRALITNKNGRLVTVYCSYAYLKKAREKSPYMSAWSTSTGKPF